MLGGSGITVEVVAKVAEAPIAPVCAGSWVKVNVKLDSKGPVRLPKNVPGVHSPSALMFRKPGTFVTTVIVVLEKVPKALLPKVRLLGMVTLNVNEGKNCVGIPTKMPVCEVVEISCPILKIVDVLRLPVDEPSAVGALMSTKAWLPIVVACAPLARVRQIATADSPERITGRIATSLS